MTYMDERKKNPQRSNKNPNLFNVSVVTLSPHMLTVHFPLLQHVRHFPLLQHVYQIISELLEGWDPVLLTWTMDFHIVGTQHISLMMSLKRTVDKGARPDFISTSCNIPSNPMSFER